MTTIYSKAGTDAAIGAAIDAQGLGTAAQSDATDFATAAQGILADATAVQQVTLTAPLAYTLPVGVPADVVHRVVFTQDTPGGHTVTYGGQPVAVGLAAGASTTVELHPVGSGYVVRYPASMASSVYDLRDYGLSAGLKAALIAACDAAHLAGGGIVYIPAGVYTYDGWPEDEAMLMAPRNGIAYHGDGAGTVLRLDASAPGYPVVLPVIGEDISVDGIRFDSNGATYATSVRIFTGSKNVSVTNCTFAAPGSGGVYIDDGPSQDIRILNNHFEGSKWGICTAAASQAHDITITGNTFRGGVGGDAIEINTPSGRSIGVTITGNTISGYARAGVTNSGIGIGVAHASGVTITGNRISDCGLDGIHVEDAAYAVVVSGNVVADCQREGINVTTSVGVSGDLALTGMVTVSNNVVTGCGLSNGEAAIAFEGSAASSLSRDLIISHNIVRGNGFAGMDTFAGIALGYGVNRAVIDGNIVTNTIGGASSAGIRVDAATDVLLIGNRATDDQGTKTQKYGLRLSGAASVRILANDFSGNATAETLAGTGNIADILAIPKDQHQLTVGDSSLMRHQATSTSITITSGTVRLAYFTATKTEPATSIRVKTGGVAAAATPTICLIGLYSVAANGDLTLIANTANDTSLFAATATEYVRAFETPAAKVAGRRYAVGILVVSTATLPTFVGCSVADAAALPYVAAATSASGGTALPATVGSAAIAGSPHAVYAAVIP